jgi:hypothetical protein
MLKISLEHGVVYHRLCSKDSIKPCHPTPTISQATIIVLVAGRLLKMAIGAIGAINQIKIN